MPLFIDGNGITRMIDVPRPFPPVIRVCRYKNPLIKAWFTKAEILSPNFLPKAGDSLAEAIEFERRGKHSDVVFNVIYETKEKVF